MSKPKNVLRPELPTKIIKAFSEFFIVAVGASAGGLQAFQQFLENIPPETGMAFIFISHLSPKHESLLPSILNRWTKMKVHEAKHDDVVKPNNIYVIPPNATMTIREGKLELLPRDPSEKPHLPIDHFLYSLSDDQRERAVAVILSGSGSDGAGGSRTIKAQGGISFAQTPESAHYPSMPSQAIAVDDVDFVLTVPDITRELTRIAKVGLLDNIEHEIIVDDVKNNEMDVMKILVLLRQSFGTDFSQYKQSTVQRRIARRMLLHRLADLPSYFKLLQDDQKERGQLNQDILINVTHFFREPHSYDELKRKYFPHIIKHKEPGAPLRIWIAACSTGEEAYSMAISLLEVLGPDADTSHIKIFATDLSEKSINKARLGKYPESINENVPEELLNRYFVKIENSYRICKEVRDLCIFSKHDVTRDPAYSMMDLISCKNLLIYFNNELQLKVMETFHYALNSDGLMILGSSEGVGTANELFQSVDPSLKIYRKKAASFRPSHRERLDYSVPKLELPSSIKRVHVDPSSYELQVEADRAILARYSPASVIINQKYEVLQFRGNTENLLSHKQGEATLNLLKLAKEGFANSLRKCIEKAQSKDAPAREERILNPEVGFLNIEVLPMRFQPGDRHFLVIFEQIPASQLPIQAMNQEDMSQAENLLITHLRQELNATKESLHSMIEDFEVANQDLQAANEEIISSNEELQSTNEELETSKEELQSTNEELKAVNDELQDRNFELFGLNNDLLNILNSVQIPILIVGNDLSIRRFTPNASRILNIISTDVGRPVTHLTSDILDVNDLAKMIKKVLENAVIQEKTISKETGDQIIVRVRPYKTETQRIEGVVITFQESQLA